MKFRIGFDIDGVLGDFMAQYQTFFNQMYPNVNHDFSASTTYNYTLLGGELYRMDGFYENMPVISGSRSTVKQCCSAYEVFAISGTPKYAYAARTLWLHEMFPEIPAENIYFIKPEEKKNFCEAMKIHLLVEDCPSTIEDFNPEQILVYGWMYNTYLSPRYQIVNHNNIIKYIKERELKCTFC